MFFRRSITHNLPDRPKRILLIRLGGVCEVLRGIPLLVALRMRFPHAEIAWLAEAQAASLLYGHRALNRIITVPRNWNHSWEDARFLRNRLKKFQPEIVIDMQSGFRSSFAAWSSDAKYRIGFAKSDYTISSNLLNNICVLATEEHEIDRNLQLLEPLGVCGCSVAFDLNENERDRFRADEILDAAGLRRNFAVLSVSANGHASRWKDERFVELAKYLQEQWNLPSLLVWDGQEERKMAESIAQKSENTAAVAPWVSSTELASIIRQATILVGPEGGPLGISSAVGTHCVGLFGATSAAKTGPYGLQNRSIQAISTRNMPTNPLDAIETGIVCEACDTLLTEILEPTKQSILEFKKPPIVITKAA